MKIHIVQKGDTIWGIAEQYGVNFEELKQMNSHISSPDMIMPGMKIKIPTTSKKNKPTKDSQKEKINKKTEKIDHVKKEEVKKEKHPNTMPLKPLQQPQLGEKPLTGQPKSGLPEVNKQKNNQKVEQHKPYQSQTQPKQNYMKNMGSQVPQQHISNYPMQSQMMHPMPVYPNYHSPCCCPCMMQQAHLSHMNHQPYHHMNYHHGHETYVFNKQS